ncbi:MAG TPA: TraM recognition domain-containing protein, partial [Rhodothermales bacterium]
LIPAALVAIFKGIDLWRHPDPKEVILPEYPPVPDLRFENALYLGSGWTRGGKQPGYVFNPAEDEIIPVDDVHVVLPEKGLFGNLHGLGGVGGGKTSTLIIPVLQQAIEKFPKPPHPDEFALGPNGRYLTASPETRTQPLRHFAGRLGFVRPAAPASDPRWNPYDGMTREEALAEFERLSAEHRDKKWGIFVIDPKGDLTEVVQRLAARVGRAEDVVVLRPDGEYTYNPLTINTNDVSQSEMVMDGIEAVSGQAIQQYWRSTMSEWLANALTILRVVDPTRVTFKSILRMARSENLRSAMVAEAEATMREAQEEEERLRRIGKTYTGVRVNPAAIEFFRDWDDVDSDPSRKQAVVSGIKSQSKFFVDDEFAPFLCPEMPATFEGFEAMIDKGLIVCLQVPLDKYGPVARVLGILVLADAQQAARVRINKKEMNQERVVLFAVDEISAFLNRLTKEFVAMNRQSRVCFMGAHQSLGQLEQHGDRSFRQSFNDNLRTKISYNAPNADAARQISGLFGSRRVYRSSHTHSQIFSRVKREAEPHAFKPIGGESAGMTTRYDEIERPWFEPEEFMTLRTGELIVRVFDGTTTLPPRKIVARPYFTDPAWLEAASLELDLTPKRPHPIVCVGTQKRDHEYVGAAFSQTGFIIVEPLANHAGELEGFKFVTDVGTLIVSCDHLDHLHDTLAERMTDPRTAVVLTDLVNCAMYFTGALGIQFDRVLNFTEAYRRVFPGTPEHTLASLFEAAVGRPLSYSALGAWEFHRDLAANQKAILKDSRDIIAIYGKLGEQLHELGDTVIEALYEETRERIQRVLADEPEPTPSPTVSATAPANGPVQDVSAEPLPGGPDDVPPPDDYYGFDDPDPFCSPEFPDVLDGAPEALVAPSAPESPDAAPSGAPPLVESPALPAERRRRERALPRARRRPVAPDLDPTLFDLLRQRHSPLDGPEGIVDGDAAGTDSVIPMEEASAKQPSQPRGRPQRLLPGTPRMEEAPAALTLPLLSDDRTSTTEPSSGSSSAGRSARVARKARRGNARAGRRPARARPPADALDLGLPANPATDPDAAGPGSRPHNPGADIAGGAPID